MYSSSACSWSDGQRVNGLTRLMTIRQSLIFSVRRMVHEADYNIT